MKEYFAKYLPVEGVIEVGDKARTPDNSIVEIKSTESGVSTGLIIESPIKLQIGHKNVFINESELKKVKLFLCSRDKQIGDIPQAIVVGEVSRKAIWAKEGDEFDKEELEQQGTGVNITINGGFVRIKCDKCKTFH